MNLLTALHGCLGTIPLQGANAVGSVQIFVPAFVLRSTVHYKNVFVRAT